MWRIESPLEKFVDYVLFMLKEGVYVFDLQAVADVTGITFWIDDEGKPRGSLPRYFTSMSPLFGLRSEGGRFLARFHFDYKKGDVIDFIGKAYYRVERDLEKRMIALMIRIGTYCRPGAKCEDEQSRPRFKTLATAFRDQLRKAINEERSREREHGIPSLGSEAVPRLIDELLHKWAELKGCLHFFDYSTEDLLKYEPRGSGGDDGAPPPPREFKGRRQRQKTDRL